MHNMGGHIECLPSMCDGLRASLSVETEKKNHNVKEKESNKEP